MQRGILPALICAALAAPGASLAQPSISVSGFFKMSFESLRLEQSAKARASEVRVVDEASRVVFSVAEDLGGGLQAIGQVDWRVTLDSGADAAAGNNFVGLRSRAWGTLMLGRHDLHYNNDPTEVTATGRSKKAAPVALLAFAGGGATAIAGNTRTANTMVWDSPRWGVFDVRLAYSANAAAAEADIGSALRKGRAWNVAPRLTGAAWQAGWSHWDSKPDGTLAGEQKADRLWGFHSWGGLKVGLVWDRSRIRTGGAGDTSRRTAWSLPLRYRFGNHALHADFTRAGDDKATAAADGARMFSAAWVYDLSKRTSIGLSYARIRNDPAAAYNFDGSAGGQGSPSGAVAAGEDPRIVAATIRHAF